ncbi:MAG: M23 family metallopeptidase, partial [Gemmatimonadota bacterium]|nr:M23 family metallopeptidase [Gemmatimonadota bacterium]
MRIRRPGVREVAVAAVLVVVAMVTGVSIYLLATDQVLVVGFRSRVTPPPAASAPGLIIPVAGVRADALRNSYGAARSGGRQHKGVDIKAPRGTPVLAAAAGVLVKRDSNAVAGRALYQRDLDGRTIYYYAHLDRYRAGLKEGDLLRQGDVIAYVGDTGNAKPGDYHLHFAV